VVATVVVAGGVKGNGSKGAGAHGIVRGVEDLDVGAEFNAEVIEVGAAGATDDEIGAGVFEGSTVGSGKLVEVAVSEGNKALDEEFRNTPERKAVEGGTHVLFDGADGAFDLGNMTVSGDGVKGNGVEGIAEAGKFTVGVDAANVEAAGGIFAEDAVEKCVHSVAGAIVDRVGVTEMDVTGDAVKEGEALHIVEIDTEDEGVMVPGDVRGKGGDRQAGVVGGGAWAVGAAPFEKSNVRTIDEIGAPDVVDGDRAVEDVAVGDAVLKGGLGGTAKEAGEGASIVSCLKLPASELLFVGGYRLDERVRSGRGSYSVREGGRGGGRKRAVGADSKEAIGKLSEAEDGTGGTVDQEGVVNGRVHGDATVGKDVADGEDVGDGGGVVPDAERAAGKATERSGEGGGENAGLGVEFEARRCRTNVLKMVRRAEKAVSGQGVKQESVPEGGVGSRLVVLVASDGGGGSAGVGVGGGADGGGEPRGPGRP
jgi:hypothetical protein